MKLKIKGDIYDDYKSNKERSKAMFDAVVAIGIEKNIAKNIVKFAIYQNAPYYFDAIECAGDLCDMFLQGNNYNPDMDGCEEGEEYEEYEELMKYISAL